VPESRSAGVRIYFELTGPLDHEAIKTIMGEFIGGLPLPPDEVEWAPSGVGHVLYTDEAMTVDDVAVAISWPAGTHESRAPVGSR
jgi:hypothetical protein